MASRQAIVRSFQDYMGASDVVLVDDMRVGKTRHICPDGVGGIQLLGLGQELWLVYGETILISYFFCTRCRKLIIFKDF